MTKQRLGGRRVTLALCSQERSSRAGHGGNPRSEDIEHPEIQQERAGQAVLDSGARPRGRDGVRMESSEELFASVAAPR